MSRKIFFSVTFIIWMVASVSFAHADSWALPKKRKFYSPNKKYYLEVTPKKLRTQLEYFQDTVEGTDNEAVLKHAKGNRAKGAFYVRRATGGYSKKREFPLLNEVSPVRVLVSDGGDYFATFDNWHSVGYGDDSVVIYRSDGSLIKAFGLKDLLTPGDIETFQRSVSSIAWGGEHYIDETNDHLVLQVVADGMSSYDRSARFHELKIELATGHPLEAKRDLFPQLKVFGNVEIRVATESSETSPGDSTCASAPVSFDSPGTVRLPGPEFKAMAIETHQRENAREEYAILKTLDKEMADYLNIALQNPDPPVFGVENGKVLSIPKPDYPAAARALRIYGRVTVEVKIDEQGKVTAARAIEGPLELRQAAETAALKARFEATKLSGKPVPTKGLLTYDFRAE